MTVFHESFLNTISLFRNTFYTLEKMCKFSKSKTSQLISSIKKSVPKNFTKNHTKKNLCRSLLFSKVAGFFLVETNNLFCSAKQMTGLYMKQSSNLIKKETSTQMFSCQFCEILKNTFFCRTPLVAASVNLLLLRIYRPESLIKDAESFVSVPAPLRTHHDLLMFIC